MHNLILERVQRFGTGIPSYPVKFGRATDVFEHLEPETRIFAPPTDIANEVVRRRGRPIRGTTEIGFGDVVY